MITLPDFDVLNRVGGYMQEVPFDVTPTRLYAASDLYNGYSADEPKTLENTYDQQTYRHYLETGKHASTAVEMLARSLHDFSMEKALDAFLANYDQRHIVGVMGGHGLKRTDPMYKTIVLISRELTMRGSLMVSGGGPGAMEATHLGAWLAGRTLEEVDEALYMLSLAPEYKNEGWLESAFDVMEKYPQKQYCSLGIPTWLYGHEPSTPFATDIAKFFENSIREDTILTVCFGGIIFTQGSAGTLQEIFQEATQDHYLSFGFASPMVFLGREFWDEEVPIYPFLEDMLERGKYQNLRLCLTDSSDEAIQELLKFRNE